MAGIYIHIPFCKTKCRYCDFYKTTDTAFVKEYVNAVVKESKTRANYLQQNKIQTIYFGGGTPSFIGVQNIKNILESIFESFHIDENPEITLEANPDDLTKEFLLNLKKNTRVNRLSIGIQSFYDKDLIMMGRRHNSKQATECIELALEYGYENIGIDLIYGLPNQTSEMWQANLDKAFGFAVKHLSAYHLTYEPGTVFNDWKKENKIQPIPEESSIQFLMQLRDRAAKAGFEHYEISNFAKPGYFSKHNTSYWKQIPYLGLGPSAHSFNGAQRSWNIPDIASYVKKINNNQEHSETETVTTENAFNEYLMLGLRTRWGVQLSYIKDNFGKKFTDHLQSSLQEYLKRGKLILDNDRLHIHSNFLMLSDAIIADLFFVSA